MFHKYDKIKRRCYRTAIPRFSVTDKDMIFYFTGTGNSKFVADFLGEALQDEIVSINDIVKYNKEMSFASSKSYIIVAPVYAWRLPNVVENFIHKAIFKGNNQLYFIGTMGSESGNCDRYCKKLCLNKGMEYMGFSGISMPNNYVISDVMLDKAEVNQKLKDALPSMNGIATSILQNKTIAKQDRTSCSALKSGIVNPLFRKFMISSNQYVVSDTCIGCSKCKELCVTNNIVMENGKPQFSNQCINCYACLHHCPKQAINIKGKTEKHGRYVCPEYIDWAKEL